MLRFATPGRLFASCHFETPAHPQATNGTFRWAKRVSTVSTYFPHFEPVISHILSQRFLTFSMCSTVSKLQQMSRFATPMRSAPSQTGESAEHFEMRLQSSAENASLREKLAIPTSTIPTAKTMPHSVRPAKNPDPRWASDQRPCIYTQAHVALNQYICTHVCTQTHRTTQHARTARLSQSPV